MKIFSILQVAALVHARHHALNPRPVSLPNTQPQVEICQNSSIRGTLGHIHSLTVIHYMDGPILSGILSCNNFSSFHGRVMELDMNQCPQANSEFANELIRLVDRWCIPNIIDPQTFCLYSISEINRGLMINQLHQLSLPHSNICFPDIRLVPPFFDDLYIPVAARMGNLTEPSLLDPHGISRYMIIFERFGDMMTRVIHFPDWDLNVTDESELMAAGVWSQHDSFGTLHHLISGTYRIENPVNPAITSNLYVIEDICDESA